MSVHVIEAVELTIDDLSIAKLDNACSLLSAGSDKWKHVCAWGGPLVLAGVAMLVNLGQHFKVRPFFASKTTSCCGLFGL